MTIKHIEDLKFEASNWALHLHNKYNTTGKPDPDTQIYQGFLAFLKGGEDVETIWVTVESYNDFLTNMEAHNLAFAYAVSKLRIADKQDIEYMAWLKEPA
ncbi:hypothetical protein AAY62_08825 [Vibrio parahaemolyticus]|uniref:hypothetical protein n=1 Tax=Vibrio parahaemolyticus TaxID=670 RepID=UPI00063EAB98|nr:hypothetical protein [Vibrio parahaemolyticus]KLI85640.1 hypothetical protein AAY62_08825 [Vibrio parahaemolyticus]